VSDTAPDTNPDRLGLGDPDRGRPEDDHPGADGPEAHAIEVQAMRRALELAARGPVVGDHARVGAVLLSPAGDVLAEGWHKGAGTPHAEVDAMRKVDPALLRGATAVVTLEPCDHTGRTGPCSVALIDAGVARVVYAVDDPGVVADDGPPGGEFERATHGLDLDRVGTRARQRTAGRTGSAAPGCRSSPGCSPTRPRRSSSGGCSPSVSAAPGSR
jgi:pyrimidine deaminase RibD-like protein